METPLFWWWRDGDLARVVVVTAATLTLSGKLTREELAALERARQAGTLDERLFGEGASTIELDTVEKVSHTPACNRVSFVYDTGHRHLRIEPPRAAEGVTIGIFEVMRNRLAPGVAPVEEVSTVPGISPNDDSPIDLRLMAALGALSLLCMTLAVRAEEGFVAQGALAGVQQRVNDAFVTFGYWPGLVTFGLLALLQVRRLFHGRPTIAEVRTGPASNVVKVPHPYLETPRAAPEMLAWADEPAVVSDGLSARPNPSPLWGQRAEGHA